MQLSEVRADDRHWIPLHGARSAPEAPPGGSNADPRNPSGPPGVWLARFSSSGIAPCHHSLPSNPRLSSARHLPTP
eukprot:1243314-Pyramimonas_sp.AAC.1